MHHVVLERSFVAIASSLQTVVSYAAALDGHKLLESLDHLATVLAIITAAVWALWARRVFSPHVDFAVSGRVFGAPGRQYVVPRISLTNLGNTRVTQLRQEGSGFRVWYAVQQAEKPFEPLKWSEPVFVQSIFEHHHWLEPGESISDEEHVIPLPSEWIAAKIEARQCVELRGLFRSKGAIEINTTAIVYGAHNGEKR
jgi:hypothetical protein